VCSNAVNLILNQLVWLSHGVKFDVKRKLKLTSRLRSLLLAAARRCTSR
jgi:hypothetical protein